MEAKAQDRAGWSDVVCDRCSAPGVTKHKSSKSWADSEHRRLAFYIYIFYSPHYSGRQNIQTRNTPKQTNEQMEKHMNGSDISHNMST